MMAITTSSSMSVNACLGPVFIRPVDSCHGLKGSMAGASETGHAAGSAFRQPKHVGVVAAIFVQPQLVVVAHRGCGA